MHERYHPSFEHRLLEREVLQRVGALIRFPASVIRSIVCMGWGAPSGQAGQYQGFQVGSRAANAPPSPARTS